MRKCAGIRAASSWWRAMTCPRSSGSWGKPIRTLSSRSSKRRADGLTEISVSEEVQRQVAENETRFRAANERIEDAALRLDDSQQHYPFVCECGRKGCVELLSLTIA